MGKRKVFLRVGLLVLLSGVVTWSQVNTGTISGTVKDSTGAAVPGATVVILNEGTGISRTATTDDGGRYTAPSLGLGAYSVTGSHEGFETEVRKGIELTVGREAIVDLSLAIGSMAQKVEVTGEAPLVETTTASLGSLVDDKMIRALPLNGRSYDQLALLQPGVILTSPNSTGGTPFTYGTGKRFSVGGQRMISNSFLLDGTDINDQSNGTPGGAAGTNLGVDTILEFKIFTNSFKAEYGHSTGSVTSAITRSGTNVFHGTAFEYIRNSAVDARNFTDPISGPPPFKRNQFGGVLGGPIKKDKTFFFAGYEGLRQGLGETLTATVPTTLAKQGTLPGQTIAVNPAVVSYLNLYPTPNSTDNGDGTALFKSSPVIVTNEDNLMVRVDHQLNSKTSIFGRYTYDNDNQNTPQPIPDLSVILASRRQYATLQATTIFSPNTLNNFRFAFNRTRSSFNPTLNPDPGISIVPGQTLGTISVGGIGSTANSTVNALGPSGGNAPYIWAFNIWEWGDDFTYVRGRHSLKIGADIQRMQDNYQNGNAVRGTLTFNTFQNFLLGVPSQISAQYPIGIVSAQGLRQTLFAVYAQDDYAVNSRLTINLGLRWEAPTDPIDANGKMAIIPSPLATATVPSNNWFSITKKNFEPRVGLAWQLDSTGKTVLRAGAGIYHNQILPWSYAQRISLPPYYGRLTANNPRFPNSFQDLTGTISATGNGKVNLIAMNPFEKTPVDDQYNLSIEREIFKQTVLQVAYAGSRDNHLLTQREADTAVPTIVNGQPFYPVGAPLTNPAWNGMPYFEMNGNSRYNSMTVTLRRQSSKGFQGQIFYTYSKSMDENSGTAPSDTSRSASAILDPNNLARDWGPSDFNATHAVVGTFSYPLPFHVDSKALGAAVSGWTLDLISTFSTGMPFTPRLSSSVSNDQSSQFVERPSLKAGFSSNPISGASAGCTGFPAGTVVGNATNWYDPCAFILPAPGTYGSLGRNTIIGPGVQDVDTALEKNFKLTERVNTTFRAEVFNLLNHANYGLPNFTALASNGNAKLSAGQITSYTISSRQIQLALRINF